MSHVEAEDSFINDAFMADELEKVPGGYFIEIGQLKLFRDLKSFQVMNDQGEKVDVDYSPEICDSFNYYFEIWDNCREFGLPNGDWTKNPPWLVDMVKNLNRVFVDIQNYRTDKRNFKGGR